MSRVLTDFFASWMRMSVLIVVLSFIGGAAARSEDSPLVPPGGYVRDRRLNEALATLQRLDRAGSGQEFATVAQWILDQPRDSIVVDADGRASSVRQSAERLLSQASRERLLDYRRLVGPTAAADLAEIDSNVGEKQLWSIVRRYFLTEAGGRAAVQLLVRGLDSGSDEIAAAVGERLLREPVHVGLITPGLRRRLEMAMERSTRHSDRVNTHPQEVVQSSEVMLRPQWSLPWEVRSQSAAIEARWKFWQGQLLNNEQSMAISAKPLVVADSVIFRDGRRIRVVNSATGHVAREWSTNLGWDSLFAANYQGVEAEATGQRRTALLVDWLVSNSSYFSLTTNGRQVFFVDGAEGALETLVQEQMTREMLQDQRRESLENDIVAISLDRVPAASNDKPNWSLRTSTGGNSSPFRYHTFLGPPAVLPGLMVVLSEVDREVFASAVNPDTGQILWMQPIAEPDLAILNDRARFSRSCTPTIARGLVLCPTQLGAVVALDLTSGAFAWVHAHYDPRPSATRPGVYRPMTALPQVRSSVFNLRPWVMGSKVVYLAGQSDSLFCLDQVTGRTHWSISQPDADAIATITNENVVLMGRSSVRALSLENGDERWSLRLPVPPSGEAVSMGGELNVPLSNGQLLRVRLTDGNILSTFIGQERQPTGHLAVTPHGLVALGADGLAGYRFASLVRQELANKHESAETTADLFQQAEVELAVGNLVEAAKQLERVRQRDPKNWSLQRAGLLRETYFTLLQTDADRASNWLESLRSLCPKGEHFSRWLIARGEWEQKNGRDQDFVRTFETLSQQPGTRLHDVANEPGLAVSGVGWMRRTLRHAHESQLRDRLTAAVATSDAARATESLFSLLPTGQAVRPQLAEQALSRGQVHAAEAWLLRNAEATDSAVAASAVRQLAELYESAGMSNAAANQWERLVKDFANVNCNGQTGSEFVRDRLRRGGSTAVAYRRQSGITWPLKRAVIRTTRRGPTAQESTERVGNPQRELVFQAERYARWRVQPRDESDFEWTQRIDGADSYLVAWDRNAQQARFQLSLAQGTLPFVPNFGRLPFERAIPIGTPAQMRMISVLQPANDGEAWSQTLPEWEDRSLVPLVGPGTLRLQLFQNRSTLVAVDPADGQFLWRRNDLEPNSGLNDRTVGVFADDQVVGVLGNDRVSYRLLDAATGEVLRSGKLDADRSTLRFAAGARLIWVVEGNDGKRVRIWDAVEDRIIFEDTVRERQYVSLTLDRELVWLSADDHLCVLDVKQNHMLVRCPIDTADVAKISSFRVFRQAGRYFLNLGRAMPAVRTEHYQSALNDHALPVTPISDDLYAVNPAGTSLAWKRSMPKASIVSWGKLPVPVLISMSKVRHKADNNHEWLRVDVHDITTGEILATGDYLPKDRWVHADYDGEHGEIRIFGLQNTVSIRFGKSIQQVPSLDDVL